MPEFERYHEQHQGHTSDITRLTKDLQALSADHTHLTAQIQAITERAVALIGNACPRHLHAAGQMGFEECLAQSPKTCEWCLTE